MRPQNYNAHITLNIRIHMFKTRSVAASTLFFAPNGLVFFQVNVYDEHQTAAGVTPLTAKSPEVRTSYHCNLYFTSWPHYIGIMGDKMSCDNRQKGIVYHGYRNVRPWFLKLIILYMSQLSDHIIATTAVNRCYRYFLTF